MSFRGSVSRCRGFGGAVGLKFGFYPRFSAILTAKRGVGAKNRMSPRVLRLIVTQGTETGVAKSSVRKCDFKRQK